MNRLSKRYLTILMCAVVAANAACSTTPGYTPSHEDSIYGISKGDRVPVRWSAGGKSEVVRITSVSYTGFSGIGEDGRLVAANYGDFYEIGHKPKFDWPDEPLTGAAKIADSVMKGIGYTVLGTFVGAMYIGGMFAGGGY